MLESFLCALLASALVLRLTAKVCRAAQREADGSHVHAGLVATRAVTSTSGFAPLRMASVAARRASMESGSPNFTWPVWLLSLVMALVGALVWFGLGVLRRHRRRKERRADRRDDRRD